MKLPQTLIIESSDIQEGFKTALSWAKENLCLEKKGKESCNECPSCLSFDRNNHPDLIIIEKPDDKKNISVDLVRQQIIKRINSRPLLSKSSVVIIKESQSLSIGAQNALLKTLEEPPAYLRIILSVNNRAKLLDTIISRSQISRITNKNKPSKEDLDFITDLLDMTLAQRFFLAKEITDKDKKEGRKDALYTLEFIDQLLRGLRIVLKQNFDKPTLQKTITHDLNKTLTDRQKILYNTNKLLVLENLMLQTLDPKIYKNSND